jgi:ActR/RegA family two-component response regulator
VSAENFNRNILFIDDQKKLTRLFESIFKQKFNVFIANNSEEAIELLKRKTFAVVISDYNLDETDKNGLDLLKLVMDDYNSTRRMLVSGELDTELVIESINSANVHYALMKPWDTEKFIKEIDAQVTEYNLQLAFKDDYQQMKSKLENPPEIIDKHTDRVLELFLNLSETDRIQDFANQFVNAIEGMKSLAILNSELYLDRKDKELIDSVMDYLSDIEVMANQFDQKILFIWVLTVRSYLHIIDGNIKEAKLNFQGIELIWKYYNIDFIDPVLIEAIKDFPQKDFAGGFISSRLPLIEIQLRKLFSIKLTNLVSVSESVMNYYHDTKSSIIFFLIIRDQMPIFEKKISDVDLNVSLISGFIVALGQFIQEVLKGSGDIDTISHEKGVILFHKSEDCVFVVFATANDVRYRIGLRQIANETRELLSQIPKSHMANEEEIDQLNEIAASVFGVF